MKPCITGFKGQEVNQSAAAHVIEDMRYSNNTTHTIWFLMCLFSGTAGFALSPLWTWISDSYLPPKERPFALRWVNRPPHTRSVLFLAKDSKVRMNIGFGGKTANTDYVAFYGDDPGNSVNLQFHRNGILKELSVRHQGALVQERGFYDTGEVEYISKVVGESTKWSTMVKKQYYDRDGKPTELQTCCYLVAD